MHARNIQKQTTSLFQFYRRDFKVVNLELHDYVMISRSGPPRFENRGRKRLRCAEEWAKNKRKTKRTVERPTKHAVVSQEAVSDSRCAFLPLPTPFLLLRDPGRQKTDI